MLLGPHACLLTFLVQELAEPNVLVIVVVFAGDGHPPHQATGLHGHVNDSATPDVDLARVIFLLNKLFRRNIRFRASKTFGKVHLVFFPHGLETVGRAKVGDLQTAVAVQQQVLWLEVTMRNAHAVQIIDATHELLKKAVGFHGLQAVRGLENEVEEVAPVAVLHDLAVDRRGLVERQEVERAHDVRMGQRGRDAEF